MSRLPRIHPISDLSRDARALIHQIRERQEPIVITQRGRECAALVPIELYRKMEQALAVRIASPRFVHREDSARFQVQMTIIDEAED